MSRKLKYPLKMEKILKLFLLIKMPQRAEGIGLRSRPFNAAGFQYLVPTIRQTCCHYTGRNKIISQENE